MSELYITGTTKSQDKYNGLMSCITSNCNIDEDHTDQVRNSPVKSFRISASIKNSSDNDDNYLSEIKRVRREILDHSHESEMNIEVTLME